MHDTATIRSTEPRARHAGRKRFVWGLLLAGVMAVSGCSNLKFVYNQAPELAYWWIDAYADFASEQKHDAREALQSFFRWNRLTQLNDYSAMLARMESSAGATVTPVQVCKWRDEALAKTDAATEQALPAIVKLLRTFTPAQIDHVAERHEKKNRDWVKERMQDQPEDRIKASLKRSRQWTDLLYGDLTTAQRDLLTQGMAQSPFDPRLALAERRARQQEMVATMRKVSAGNLSDDAAAAAVRTLAQHMRQSPDAAYRAYQDKLQQHQCMLAAQLHNSTTPPQRIAAAKRLRGWQDDLRELRGTTVAASP